MLDYDFIKIIYDFIQIYKEFPLPAIICDESFQVQWSNSLAKSRCSYLARRNGVRDTLAGYGLDEVRAKMTETGNCTIQNVFPPEEGCLTLSPILKEGDLIGAVALYLPDITLQGLSHNKELSGLSDQTFDALSSSIRDAVNDMFEALDVVAIKADMMNVGWLKSGLNAVSVNSYGILRIAGNVGEYAKHRREGGGLQPVVVNLQALLEQMRPIVEELCGLAGIPIFFRSAPEGLYVTLDIRQFEIAFYNLLHNSITYSKPGNRIAITIRPHRRDVAISIQDSGLGIPQEVLEEVTRPYVTYRHAGSRVGAGLGLALAKQVAEAHGGTFSLESVEGEGTLATLYLPGTSFSQQLALGQDTRSTLDRGRFSAAYVGLMDAVFHYENTQR